MRIKNLLRVAVYGGALTLLAWAFWIEPDSLRVNDYTLELAGWPQAQDGLRIAVISDIHAGAPWIDEDKLHDIVRLTMAAQPDLILIAGDCLINDIVGGHYMPPDTIARALAGLHAPLGVYAVPGNHEHRRDGVQQLRVAFEGAGIHTIDHEHRRIRAGRYDFWLAGFDNLPFGLGMNEHWADAFAADDTPLLALAHDAGGVVDYLPATARARITLLMTGHSHGGQVYLPLIGAPMLKLFQHMTPNRVYRRGYYAEHPELFVTSGIGTSNLGVRLGVPPEIALLTLRHAQAAP